MAKMKNATAAMLLVGIAAATFILLTSIFAVSSGDGQSSGKTFQSMLISTNFSDIHIPTTEDFRQFGSTIFDNFGVEGSGNGTNSFVEQLNKFHAFSSMFHNEGMNDNESTLSYETNGPLLSMNISSGITHGLQSIRDFGASLFDFTNTSRTNDETEGETDTSHQHSGWSSLMTLDPLESLLHQFHIGVATARSYNDSSEYPSVDVAVNANAATTGAVGGDKVSMPTSSVQSQQQTLLRGKPTNIHTQMSAEKPTFKQTNRPTDKPTCKPTMKPTSKPTIEPTLKPTSKPTTKLTTLPAKTNFVGNAPSLNTTGDVSTADADTAAAATTTTTTTTTTSKSTTAATAAGLVLHPKGVHGATPAEVTSTGADAGTGTAAGDIEAQMTCTKSFEPTCAMYPYVRFWNKRFYPEDCYQSPLKPKRPLSSIPYSEQKYVTFELDIGGWNNIRMGAETAMLFAHATGRTLVMPPKKVYYLLWKNIKHQDNESNFDKFFDFKKISEGLNIITMEDFLEHVAKPGLLKTPLPADVDTKNLKRLWSYLEKANYMRWWEPGKFFMGFNISDQNPFGSFQRNKQTQPRYKEMVAHGRELVPYDAKMHSERAIHFMGKNLRDRLLTHFYTYLYWEDFHTEQIYKRIVRDRLHYHDDIFCAAGRVVRNLHEDAATLNGPGCEVQSAARMGDAKTLGGNTNHNATYFAFHIRRGDFQYKNTRLSAQQLWNNTKHLLNSSITNLIYIATDEKDHRFFTPFMQPPYHVKFLSDYMERSNLQEGEKFNMNHIGMIEQVVCANAHTFIGTPLSTFTGYITRMRGYYRDGRYDRTYYTLPSRTYELQRRRPLVGPFWAREFEKAHRDIDDYFDD